MKARVAALKKKHFGPRPHNGANVRHFERILLS